MKNPKHQTFIPIRDLLDAPWLAGDERKMMELLVNRTVRLKISYTSEQRPDGFPFSRCGGSSVPRLGTGFICDINESNGRCPCHNEIWKHWTLTINTSNHVVFNQGEAVRTMVSLFYDDENAYREGKVIDVPVVEFLWSNPDRDISTILCVTHDGTIAERLGSSSLLWPSTFCPTEFDLLQSFRKLLAFGSSHYALIVSHPHGQCKKITIGKVRYNEAVNHIEYEADTCPGSSGAPVVLINPRSPTRISMTHVLLIGLLRTKAHSGYKNGHHKPVNYSFI